MKTRSEHFTQTAGAGQLEVRGGPLESALFVGGAPLIFDAADCSGSIGRFTVLLGETRPELDAQIEAAAASGFASDAPLFEQIAPLLKLLPNGEYDLTLGPMEPSSEVMNCEQSFGAFCRASPRLLPRLLGALSRNAASRNTARRDYQPLFRSDTKRAQTSTHCAGRAPTQRAVHSGWSS